MKKTILLFLLAFVLSMFCSANENAEQSSDDFWRISEMADQADKENFREYIGRSRKAAEELNMYEAEYYAKEAKKYIVDTQKDKDEYMALIKLIEDKKKIKLEMEKKEKLRNNGSEEGDVLISDIDIPDETTTAAIDEEIEKRYNLMPVYVWQKTLTGETKYILRYKQMFCVISYDKILNKYYVDLGTRKTFESFIDVMRYAIGEVNYKGNVTDIIEVPAEEIYED